MKLKLGLKEFQRFHEFLVTSKDTIIWGGEFRILYLIRLAEFNKFIPRISADEF